MVSLFQNVQRCTNTKIGPRLQHGRLLLLPIIILLVYRPHWLVVTGDKLRNMYVQCRIGRKMAVVVSDITIDNDCCCVQ